MGDPLVRTPSKQSLHSLPRVESMAEEDKAAAERGLRERLGELEGDLDRIVKGREDVQRSIEVLRKQSQELVRRESEMAAEEGALRGQIGELSRALEAFES